MDTCWDGAPHRWLLEGAALGADPLAWWWCPACGAVGIGPPTYLGQPAVIMLADP